MSGHDPLCPVLGDPMWGRCACSLLREAYAAERARMIEAIQNDMVVPWGRGLLAEAARARNRSRLAGMQRAIQVIEARSMA